MSVTAADIKKLRDMTGAGMMDCKKALVETSGDLEAAVDWLRKKGLAAASKKSGRAAAEGLVGVTVEGNTGALVEVNAETDFVGRNEKFQEFVTTVTKMGLEMNGDIEAMKTTPYPGSDKNVADELTNLIAVIGENMSLRRTESMSVDNGAIASYVHGAVAPNMGRIGVLVGLESTADQDALQGLAKELEPVIEYFKSVIPKYPGTKRKMRKIKYAFIQSNL